MDRSTLVHRCFAACVIAAVAFGCATAKPPQEEGVAAATPPPKPVARAASQNASSSAEAAEQLSDAQRRARMHYQVGVENLRQMEVLHRLGCGVMQGFLFSRPQPPEDIETWLQQTVLPRKAPWIGKAGDADFADALRSIEGRAPRAKPVA